MKQNKFKKTKSAFTLIELMVAVGLFSLIIIVGAGALLNTNFVRKNTETVRAVVDNLNFVMEDMSRNIRLGSLYSCDDSGGYYNDASGLFASPLGMTIPTDSTPLSCPNGSGILSFESVEGDPTDEDDQHGYVFVTNASNQAKLYKTTDGGDTWISLTPPEVMLDPIHSGFTVIGSDSDPDFVQPLAIIRLTGQVMYKGTVTPFSIETSVSQRLLES
jgi:prepilin-type N-terminal cleavage/methylation domain-containing protein